MPSSARIPLRPLLAAIALAGSLAFIAVQPSTARRDRQTLELLRLENESLSQEVRLLRQHLEAERILAAAQTRLARDAAAASSSPQMSAPVPPAP